jgi:K+:H+ antiporter
MGTSNQVNEGEIAVNVMQSPAGVELHDVLIYLLAAVIIVPLFRKIKLSPILGYLIAGGILGPYGFATVDEVEAAHTIAEYGIVFLLFTIGLELSFDRLKTLRRYVFGLGSLQFCITSIVIGLLAYFLGAPGGAAVIIGGALALSSTAFVLHLLGERSELSTRFGRGSFSVLLFQDLAVVPLLAITPLMNLEADKLMAGLGSALLTAFVALFVIVVLGRVLLRPIYRVVASSKSPEAFIAMTLLVVLGTGWATMSAGLSMTLGAFLAGLLLAETEYRHQIEADIMPFKGMLLGLFFMSVGMQIDFSLALEQFSTIGMLLCSLLFIKAIILFTLSYLFKFEIGPSLRLAILLSQGGEFAFAILNEAVPLGVIPPHISQLVYVTVALSMVATPFLVMIFWPLCARWERKLNTRLEWLSEETEDLKDHVIVAGYGRVGEMVSKILTKQGVSFVALDVNAARVAEGRSHAMPVYYGDASFGEVLRAVGAPRAKAIVITLGDPKLTARAITNIRYDFPKVEIFVRARDGAHVRELQQFGVTATVPETLEASLQLGGAVLRAFDKSNNDINRVIEGFRRDGSNTVSFDNTTNDGSEQSEDTILQQQQNSL